MFGLLLTLLILDGLLLGVVVLLQSGKGGGLAAMGGGGAGTDSFIGGRQATTLLTKASWVTGGIFLGLALLLSVMSTRARTPQSVLEQEFRQTAPAPAAQPVLPGAQPGATDNGATQAPPTSDAGAPGSQQP